jgi:5-(carboxyamino)imidazole ribonucleotide mutase
VPVATFAIGESGAVNAGLHAVAMLARTDRKLAAKLEAFRRKQTRTVLDAELPPLQ